MPSHQIQDRSNSLSKAIIGAAIEVHRNLGPGLLESAYEACLCQELSLRSIAYERQVGVPISYKGLVLDCSYRIDILVENLVIVEVKSIERMDPIHQAQIMTYLRIKQLWLGVLLNFNVPVLRDGIKRVVL